MAIEQVGPGNVSNSYGVRTVNQPVNINSVKPKDVYNEYGAERALYLSANGSSVVDGAGNVQAFLNQTANNPFFEGAGRVPF